MNLNPMQFWGKASPSSSEVRAFHPLVCHALDVAATFEALLAVDMRARERLEATFATGIDRLSAPLAALVALHDIGKVDKRFQAKSEEAWPQMLGSWPGPLEAYDHAAGTDKLLNEQLADVTTRLMAHLEPGAQAALLKPIAFHHGKPCNRLGDIPLVIGEADASAARVIADAILDAFGSISSLPPVSQKSAQGLSWLLSGLVSLADWIGSSTEFFPYVGDESPNAAHYWRNVARMNARTAIQTLRLAPMPPDSAASFATLFDSQWTPSASQVHCGDLPLVEGPMLVVIEDVTGSGKTESALLLAQRMMRAHKGHGVFIALPTMATANAMYQRMANSYRRLFAAGEQPSLSLAHGRAGLHKGFRASILPNGGAAEACVAGEIETVQAGCSAFFADDRRKALLADIGVGTIDQALLGVLPTKYATLRLYALAGKILVIDEAHAYDAYMSREVERLLTFHAGLGGSAILLSATLPRRMKEALARAFRGGVHRSRMAPADRFTLSEDAYPLVTTVPFRGAVVETPLAAREDLRRKVVVTQLDSREAALARIAEAAKQGAAVAYIRNSVDDAIEAWEALRERGFAPLLFHARFAMIDRQRVELEALTTFGKEGTPDQRRGRILIATQVVEQSLDLDFDLVVSDLAPIDLLIQRAGRLWRHRRHRPIEGPYFFVVSPEPNSDAGESWFKAAFPRAAHVYKAHALLWASAKTLFDAGAIVSPEGVRTMIESVYGGDVREKIPPGLQDNFNVAEGAAYGERGQADNNLLDFAKGYIADHRGWSDDVRTPTRLGEEQTTLRLAFWRDGRLRPYALDDDETRAWALSEVSIRKARVTGRGACAPEIERAAVALEESWRKHGDWSVILPLEGDEPWAATIASRDRDGKTASYKTASYSEGIGLKFQGLL
ncbi:MAG: CRISPR-associated helicase Cas3' [Methylocystis sp.]